MENSIIQIKDLTRNFTVGSETVHALRGVSYDVRRGEFLTIMGTSGSGKTTMLNILGCLDKPTSGSYMIDGVQVSTLSKNDLARLRNQKIGFVFQSFNLLARTSALENVELPLLYSTTIPAGERRQRAEAALVAVGLEHRMDHTPNQLSGGQQQRVAIARALVNDPVMILADEATGNLDTRTTYEIMNLFQKLNHEQGKTIVFVTHEPEIGDMSKRTIMLRDGLIISDAPALNRLVDMDHLPKTGA